MKGADILCRLLQDCNKRRFYFLEGCIDLCLADLQRLQICLVKLLRIGEQGRVSLLPDLCKDVRHNIGNIGLCGPSCKNFTARHFAVFHHLNHFALPNLSSILF